MATGKKLSGLTPIPSLEDDDLIYVVRPSEWAGERSKGITKQDFVAGITGTGAVDSVNTQTGAVVLDADDIDDSATTNKFTTAADVSKLAGIEASATADQTGAEIKALYEAEADTNAFTDAEKTLLGNQSGTNTGDQDISGIATNASAISGKQATLVSGTNIKTINGSTVLGSGDLTVSAGDIEGTAVKSTGETGGSKFLREDGDGTCSWQAIGGGGDMLAANNLSDLTNTTNARTNLGVDAAGTDNSTDVTLTGTGTYISIAGQVITVDPITESDISDLGTYSTDIHGNIAALDNVSGTNTGDQTSIVGITGTKAQFDTAVTDGDIMYVGDAPTSHTHTKSDITDFNEADYATGAEGDLASTSIQPADIGVSVQAYSSVLQNTTASFLTADETKLDGIEAGAEVNDTVCISFAISDETTDLTTGTTKATFRMPFALTLTDVRASVSTAPTGSTLIVDINETATTILSTKLSIDAGEKTSATAASAVVISDTALADDAEITFDIDQVGSTVAGAGLKIYLIGNR